MNDTPTQLDGLDANKQLVGWAALNQLGKWVCHAGNETWIAPTQEAAEEALIAAGAVRVKASSDFAA
jgi:hypothetical protein